MNKKNDLQSNRDRVTEGQKSGLVRKRNNIIKRVLRFALDNKILDYDRETHRYIEKEPIEKLLDDVVEKAWMYDDLNR